MKNYLLIFGFFTLLFSACSDEFENVETEINYPDTEVLVNANLEGVVTNVAGEPLNDIIVDVLIDGYLLASTTTNNGVYSFINQPSHKTNTIIRAHSKTYAPNFSSIRVEAADVMVKQDLVVGQFLKTQDFDSNEAIDFAASNNFNASLSNTAFSNASNVLLGAQVYPTAASTTEFISIRSAVDADGNEAVIQLEQVYYLGAYDLNDDAVVLKTDSDFTLQFPANGSAELYSFDIELAKWTEVTDFTTENDTHTVNTNHLTYYAMGSSYCQNDVTSPVCIVINNSTYFIGQSNLMYAEDLNNGSFDDCTTDDNLVFQIRKQTDVCSNGSDVFGPTVKFCAAEIGTAVTVDVLVMDESGNVCIIATDVRVEGNGTDCAGDVTPPIPYCFSEITVSVPFASTTLDARNIDAGSYDDCATDLLFLAKKITDICNNGSDEYKSTVTFCSAEVGTNVTVRMSVTDSQGNFDFCDMTVKVVGNDCDNDNLAPVPVVVQNYEHSLSTGDFLYPSDIDNGSWDNCTDDLLLTIKKETDICANGSDQFGDSIEMCSAEVGTELRVFFNATDEAGNANQTWCNVKVVD